MRRGVFSLLLVACAMFARAEEATVAVASNFTEPMTELARVFEAQSGHRLRLVFGSSGKFYAQIRQGAPFHVFLSADQEKPQQLERDGLVVAGSRFTYALGRLALWAGPSSTATDPLQALREGRFNKLALANPRLAPYGEAAVRTLDALGLLEATQPQWVQGENIAQTYQFVSTGNADLGLVALSQLDDSQRQRSWVVPQSLHEPIRQDAVWLKSASGNTAARDLLAFLRSVEAQALIEQFGYGVASGAE